jgi:hypothetical protein
MSAFRSWVAVVYGWVWAAWSAQQQAVGLVWRMPALTLPPLLLPL